LADPDPITTCDQWLDILAANSKLPRRQQQAAAPAAGSSGAGRYQRLLAALQDSENVSPSAIKGDSPATPAPQPASSRSAPLTAPQQPDGAPDLTGRQRKVIEVSRDSVQRRGYPPLTREIGRQWVCPASRPSLTN
jgi:hypothetical protein